MASMRRVNEVIEAPAEDPGDAAAAPLSFAAIPGDEILSERGVRFAPRQLTAIVGGEGDEKAAIINLLLRSAQPDEGMILIDGRNIAEARAGTLRGQVGIIEQDAILFDGTVMDNLLYGNEGLERGDAMRAAMLARAHDFIERLPGGYDAPVGRGGGFLSLGQRLRIILARTLLGNPAVILFDETPSDIDAESELCLHQAITALKQSRTVIVLAHRLATLKSADTIMVLDEGRFVEEGTFDQLLEKRGAFFQSYWRLFGGLFAFRQQLEVELERAARYHSRFCLAALRLAAARGIEEREGVLAAEQFVEEVDLLLKKRIRVGDNSVVLGDGTILILLPEIDEGQLLQFFRRMRRTLPEGAAELTHPIAEGDLSFTGASVCRKAFRTPEELLSALVARAGAAQDPGGMTVMTEEELAGRPGGAT